MTALAEQPKRELRKINSQADLKSLLEACAPSLQSAMPKHLKVDRLIKMALIASSRQPKLLECNQTSILRAVMQAAELGLDCSGTLGQAYLVPFYNSQKRETEVQFMPGYRGLIDLARRGGQISMIHAQVVHEKDTFDVEFGTDPKINHKPLLSGDRGNMTAVYAVAVLTDGSKQFEVMTVDQVDAIKKRSKAGQSGPWVTDYTEMARKTVVKRLCKYLPLSVEMEKALTADNEVDGFGDGVVVRTVDHASSRSATDDLVNRLQGEGQEPLQDEVPMDGGESVLNDDASPPSGNSDDATANEVNELVESLTNSPTFKKVILKAAIGVDEATPDVPQHVLNKAVETLRRVRHGQESSADPKPTSSTDWKNIVKMHQADK